MNSTRESPRAALHSDFRKGSIDRDRILMLLSGETNLREVGAFVMNGQYEDPMMGAPSAVDAAQLADLHIRVVPPVK